MLTIYMYMLRNICPVPSGHIFESFKNNIRVCAKLFIMVVNSVMAEDGRTDKRKEYGPQKYAKVLVPGSPFSTRNTKNHERHLISSLYSK